MLGLPSTMQKEVFELTITEAELAKHATAPRVTAADIEANIKHCFFTTGYAAAISGVSEDASPSVEMPEELRLLTVCLMVLQNGYTLIGHSACASKANFNEEIGQRLAREDCIRQMWAPMGYHLRQNLHEAGEA